MATLVGGYVPNFSHVVFWVFVSGSAHLIQGSYSHPTDFILITYIGQLLQTFDKYNSV